MSKRYSTSHEMRGKLDQLDQSAKFVAGFDKGLRDGVAEEFSASAQPLHTDDLDRGRWVRDPSTGEKIFVRSGGAR